MLLARRSVAAATPETVAIARHRANEALELAQEADDPALIAQALAAMNDAYAGPAHTMTRRDNADTIVELAVAVGVDVDRDVLRQEELNQRVIGECRALGGELCDLLGVLVAWGVRRGGAEITLDAVPGRSDLLDVPCLHLLTEERIGHRGPLRAEHGTREQPVDHQEKEDDPPEPAEDS